ncbi:MAG: hypothetical protein ACOC3J_05835 [Gemmatimonadota bacterium]
MMKRVLMAVMAAALLAAPAPAGAQERGPDRRAQLEQQVRRQFVMQVARRLDLSESQRERMGEVIRVGAEARAALARESRELRLDLMEAVRDEDATPQRYAALLERLDALRDRERELERREEAAIAEFLDPRQQASFLIMRYEFNERVRGMRGPGARGRPGGGPGGGMGGPGGPGGPGGRGPF